MSASRRRRARAFAASLPAVASFAVVVTWAALALTVVYAVANLAAWGAAREFEDLLASPMATFVYAASHESPLLLA